jgi:hypothetical protein
MPWDNYFLTFKDAAGNTILPYQNLTTQNGCIYSKPISGSDTILNGVFNIPPNKKMVFSAWVRETTPAIAYTHNSVSLLFNDGSNTWGNFAPSGPVIEGWQRYEGYFTPPSGATTTTLFLVNNSGSPIYFDDIRIHPYNANMKSYVYDPVNLRLTAELDANNYATFYEYDEEGTLIRTKAETRDGIKTITETRSAKQKNIINLQ